MKEKYYFRTIINTESVKGSPGGSYDSDIVPFVVIPVIGFFMSIAYLLAIGKYTESGSKVKAELDG